MINVGHLPSQGPLSASVQHPPVQSGEVSEQDDVSELRSAKVPRRTLTTYESHPLSHLLSTLSLLDGDEAITQSGIVPAHADAICMAAKDLDCVLMFRPVNPLSTSLLAAGMAAKSMAVKGKSSDWGPMAGYIPVDQVLSKIWNDPEKVEKLNHANQQILCIDRSSSSAQFVELPLVLSEERITELVSEPFKLISIKEPDEEKHGKVGASIKLELTHSDDSQIQTRNRLFEFKLIRELCNQFSVHYRTTSSPESEWKSVSVIGQREGDYSNAITADYDAFAYLPSFNYLKSNIPEKKDQAELTEKIESIASDKQLSPLGNTELRKKFHRATHRLLNDYLQFKNRQLQDKNVGGEPTWQIKIRDTVNAYIKSAGYPSNIVLHATEQDNSRHPERDEQIFIATPEGEAYLTKSWTQVEQVFQAINNSCDLFDRHGNVLQHRSYLVYHNRKYMRQPVVAGDTNTPNNRIIFNPYESSLKRQLSSAQTKD